MVVSGRATAVQTVLIILQVTTHSELLLTCFFFFFLTFVANENSANAVGADARYVIKVVRPLF